jgi:hypothetical protein
MTEYKKVDTTVNENNRDEQLTPRQRLCRLAEGMKPERLEMLLSLMEKDPQGDGLSQGRWTPDVVETRPHELECDVVRFQNNKEKWVAFVGLLGGHPYEIFTGLQDDDEGIMLPKSVTKGKIIKNSNPDGTHRYDFQFENKRGYKTTVEGLSS